MAKKPATPPPRWQDARPKGGSSVLGYLALLLALVPLGLHTLSAPQEDTSERINEALEQSPEAAERFASKLGEYETLDDLMDGALDVLPEKRLPGALLPNDTWMHWVFALLAAGGFFAVAIWLFDTGDARTLHMLAIGVFTATGGILLLFAFQWIADATQGTWVRGGGLAMIIFYVIKLIGFSYSAAMDPDTGFALSFLGYTLGVGLCEEICKALPLIFYLRGEDNRLDWRGACAWGLASGVGFGVVEGIMYSSDYYNGICGPQTYLVRFMSCVALHAMWAAAGGVLLHRGRNWLVGDLDFGGWFAGMAGILVGPMILHGLYDTLLKKDMPSLALAVAIASGCFLAGAIHWASRGDD